MNVNKFARWVLGGVVVHDVAKNYMRITREQKAAAGKPRRSNVQKDESPSQHILDLARELEANAEED